MGAITRPINGNTNAINTDLITPAINCTSQQYIALQFYQFFDLYYATTATVSISTDSVSWTQIYDAVQDYYNAGALPQDPEAVQLNISAYDAAYIAVAKSRGVELFSRDSVLRT